MKILGRGFIRIFFLCLWFQGLSTLEHHQSYIIHLDHSYKPSTFSTQESWHVSILAGLPFSKEKSLLYSYNHAIHGFSARLTKSQLSELEKLPAHRATYRETYAKFLTTYTPKFIGLKHNTGLWPAASYGKNVIIGMIDTGIWPESRSFHDKGMPAIPKRWKGVCENGTEFSSSNCNLKLIGARTFKKGVLAEGENISQDYNSARDFVGHGTHTASTAAGNNVPGATQFGYAMGTARGVAPHAHLAIYKVGWQSNTTAEVVATDVLAAMDHAIADGVDLLSLSLGFDQNPYFADPIAIASLAAIQRGITVVCASGNDGHRYSVVNGAPWIITVGAGTTDRSLGGTFTLDNGVVVQGNSFYPQSIYLSDTPLFYGNSNISKAQCSSNALDPSEVRGKVVLCDTDDDNLWGEMQEVERAGALLGVFMNYTLQDSDTYTLSTPYMVLNSRVGASVKKYARSADALMVKEMKFVTTKYGLKPAPQVTSFSSRGPNPITPGILKPDVLAPGKDVLGATRPNKRIMKTVKNKLVSDYAFDSGSSMAAPHVSGLAALLKSVHHDWSPAAIRSAIMTSAYTLDNMKGTIKDQSTGKSSSPLDFGAGHINANKAMDPGMIFDIEFEDYVGFICSLGYSKKHMSAIIRSSEWYCIDNTSDLNYPSFVVVAPKNSTYPMVKRFIRVVTNVGESSIYQAILEAPAGIKIKTEPSTLSFTSRGQKQRFVLSVTVSTPSLSVNHGYLKWVDQHNHVVSSPIVIVV